MRIHLNLVFVAWENMQLYVKFRNLLQNILYVDFLSFLFLIGSAYELYLLFVIILFR